MRIGHFLRCGVVSLCAVLVLAFWSFAKDEPSDELVQMVVKLLSEQDKDLRAVGLDQIRNEAKGTAATKQFAAQLPKLNAAEQVALLGALADRGDNAALPAVIELIKNSDDETVRVAAITTIGSLGDSTNLALLLKTLSSGSAAEKTAAKLAVQRLRGEDVPGAIAAALKNSPPPMCVVLIEVLAERRALTTVGDLLTAATGDDAKVRRAAMAALAQLASANHLPGMFRAVLKAEKGTEREAAEKAVTVVAAGLRMPTPAQRDVVGVGNTQRAGSNRSAFPRLAVSAARRSTLSSNQPWPTMTRLAAKPVYERCATGPTRPSWTKCSRWRKKPIARSIGR